MNYSMQDSEPWLHNDIYGAVSAHLAMFSDMSLSLSQARKRVHNTTILHKQANVTFVSGTVLLYSHIQNYYNILEAHY